MSRPLVVASNRGPVTLVRADDGSVTERRGVGGLVTAVGGALGGRDATWICAAMSDEDRARGRIDLSWGEHDLHVRFADIDAARYDAYYNGFANRTLWFVDHDLRSFVRFDEEEWAAYSEVNERFAALVLDEAADDALVLLQDYHLALTPALVRRARPDLPIAIFWHTPFADPGWLAALPDEVARALLTGMLGAEVCGFHAHRWADAFRRCCAAVLGADVDGDDVIHDGRRTAVLVFPLGVDVGGLREEASSASVDAHVATLDRDVGERTLILRADRTDLTKNIVRGLEAYALLLERRPDLHGRVTHAAYLSPSRGGIPEYETYLDEVHALAARINQIYGTPSWTPLTVDVANDFPRSLAGYRRYDVLIVNPIYDGMNLVAREGPLLNERDGVLVLSRNAGAAEQLGEAALMIDPFDVDDTARALEAAVTMPTAERAAHAARLRAVAAGTAPAAWLGEQIEALEAASAG